MDRPVPKKINRTAWRSRAGIFLAVLFFIVVLPMAAARLLMQGGREEESAEWQQWFAEEIPTGYEAVCKREAGDIRVPLESCLISILAGVMEADAPKEALRAAAILLRTQAVYETEKYGRYIAEGYRSQDELKRQWGNLYEAYIAVYAQAVSDTKGIIMTHGGEAIDTAYHQISAGTTRDAAGFAADHELLWKSVRCEQDMLEEGYRTVIECGAEKLTSCLKELTGTDRIAGVRIVIEQRDEAGYVLSLSVTGDECGGMLVGGERFRAVFGLPSSDFLLEQTQGGVRFTCFGRGHGYGMSICYAKTLAGQGYGCMDILRYFFKEIEFMRIA